MIKTKQKNTQNMSFPCYFIVIIIVIVISNIKWLFLKKKSIITLQSQCKPFALWVGVKTILNWYKITEKPIKDTLSCMKDKLNDWQVLCVPIHSACGLYQTAIEV